MKIKKSIPYILIFLLYILIMCFAATKKTNYFVDELLSYNLANGKGWFQPELGETYSPADQTFISFMANKGTVNLSQVWRRQEGDVHPPFYYMCLHLVCRLFPHKFNMWLGISVNIFFQLVSLYYCIRMAEAFFDDNKAKCVVIIGFVCCAGMINISTLIRMYTAAMTFVMAITYIHLSRKDGYRVRDLLAIFVISVCGALTHYYFIFYVVLLSVVMGIIWIIEKKWKELMKFSLTMVLAGISAYLIFPAMIDHVFSSYRSDESISNLKNSSLLGQLSDYFNIIDENLFGKMLIAIVIFTIISLVIYTINYRVNIFSVISNDTKRAYAILFIPTIVFIVVISKSAIFNTDRYISPIFAVLYFGVMLSLYKIFKIMVSDEQIRIVLFSLFVAVMSCNGFRNITWNYLFEESADMLEYADENAGNRDAIIIFEDYWRLVTSYEEIARCKTATYFQASSYEEIENFDKFLLGKNDVVLFIVGLDEEEKFVRTFEENNPKYNLLKNNGKYGYGTSYYYSKANDE